MTPEIADWIKLLGTSAVFLFQLKVLWDAFQANHAETMQALRDIRGEQESIKSRLMKLETEFEIYDPPTNPNRPTQQTAK